MKYRWRQQSSTRSKHKRLGGEAEAMKTPDGSRRAAKTDSIVAEGREPSGDFRSKLRENSWTRNGSVRSLFDEVSLEAAVVYTLEAQEAGGSKPKS